MSSRENNNVQSGLLASIYNPEYLLHQSRWIRDDLDLQVARDGPDALHSNDVLTLDEFLRRLLTSNISVDDIRTSRLHLTISAVAGHATRWPTKLIDKAEALKVAWEKQYGPLKKIKVPLYEKGGRLHGICGPEDITMESMLVKWLKNPGVKVSPLMARRRGDLGFKPGEYVRFVLISRCDPADSKVVGGSAHCSHYRLALSIALGLPVASLLMVRAPTPS